jgi:predicted RNA-binding Zn ribbon-like protein
MNTVPQPGGREPAPGRLALVQAFVNTNDIEGRRDSADRPDTMKRWLVEQRLLAPDDALDEADFVRLLDIRESLRSLALASNGLQPDHAAVATLNRAAAGTLAVYFTPAGEAIRPAEDGVDRAIGHLLAAVLESMRDGTWSRVKACRREACRWLFYDHSRNRSSSWCSMAVCGNRTKTSAYRRRKERSA